MSATASHFRAQWEANSNAEQVDPAIGITHLWHQRPDPPNIAASGHENRTKRARPMTASTNAAKREKSSCQVGAVHTWHKVDANKEEMIWMQILPSELKLSGGFIPLIWAMA